MLGGRLPTATCPSMGVTSLKPPGTEVQSERREERQTLSASGEHLDQAVPEADQSWASVF